MVLYALCRALSECQLQAQLQLGASRDSVWCSTVGDRIALELQNPLEIVCSRDYRPCAQAVLAAQRSC